jgi:hypothetical protein
MQDWGTFPLSQVKTTMSQVSELKEDLKVAKKQARAVAKDYDSLTAAVNDAIVQLKAIGTPTGEPVAEWAFRDAAKSAVPNVTAVIADLEAAIGIEQPPTITGMTPQQCMIGDPDFTLMIAGDNLSASTVINFASHDEPTTYNEDGTVSTGVKPSLWLEPVVVPVMLRNGSAASEAMQFTFSGAGAP